MSTNKSSTHQTTKILLVEDQDIWVQILRREFELMASEITLDHASNGEEAIKLIQAGEIYAAVIMDLVMPIKDGYETTRYLRKEGLYTGNIIGFTSLNSREDKAKALEAGMNGLIVKEADMGTLKNLLKQCQVLL